MALKDDGTVVDPYGGQRDLASRTLRHVSPAFAEDPVRILRIARFAARYHHLGFTVAKETRALMTEMVTAGEVDHLVAERVWKELHRALAEPNPEIFIEELRACGALARIMPEVDSLWGVPQRAEYHPEIDAGVHTLMSLQQAVQLTASTQDTRVRFAVLVHDVGKGQTPVDELPRHIEHEVRGVPMVQTLCERLGVPKEHRELALHVTEMHLNCHRVFELKPNTVLKMLQKLDAFRRPERLPLFALACMADARGRTGFEDKAYPQVEYLQSALEAAANVNTQELIAQGHTGKALGDSITQARIHALQQVKKAFSPK